MTWVGGDLRDHLSSIYTSSMSPCTSNINRVMCFLWESLDVCGLFSGFPSVFPQKVWLYCLEAFGSSGFLTWKMLQDSNVKTPHFPFLYAAEILRLGWAARVVEEKDECHSDVQSQAVTFFCFLVPFLVYITDSKNGILQNSLTEVFHRGLQISIKK